MTTEEFVQACYREKQQLLQHYLEGAGAEWLRPLNSSSPEHRLALEQLLDVVLTDTFYTMLLGLEGSGSIGGSQAPYELRDREGNLLTNGDIGGYAWQYFQNDGQEE
ncbi:hypothetical protein [Hymenobacter norwichensis]|uniref:hypothetical protein n=1 Tax=Hymenobacter norwichensis TaxID=223903 RepID=UPI0003B32A3A|nr:hypothetical protein [Hymenobacter norwichensis]